jgi:hypothetical protein
MSNLAQRSDSPSLSDLAVDLAGCADGAAASAFLIDLHGATCGALLCSLPAQPLADLFGKLGESGCSAVFATLSNPAVLPTLAATIETLKAPHVAPTDEVGGKMSGISKATVVKAEAAAIGRAYKATALESPDLSALADSALAAELSDYGIEAAQQRGAKEPAFKAQVDNALSHGATCGASTHRKEAVKWAQAVADRMFLSVAVLLELECCEFDKAGEPTAADFPCCADSAAMLVEYVGLANISIKAAQEKALATMPKDATAKQRSAACKGARNVIVTRVTRQLKKYGVAVNLQTGDYAEGELAGGATKAEKACKAVVGAFDKSADGALDGLKALDGASWAAMVAFVTAEQGKRDQVARGLQNVSLGAMALANAIKAKATDDAARAAAKKDANN